MKKPVLAVVPMKFEGKDGKPVEMSEIYLQADDGRLGSLFVSFPVAAGDMVELVTEVRDGRVKLRCKRPGI